MAASWVPINQLYDAAYTLAYPQLCNFGLPQSGLLTIKSEYAGLIDNDTPIRVYIDGLNGAGQLGVGFYADTYPRYKIYLNDTSVVETSFNTLYAGDGYSGINQLVTSFPYGDPLADVSLYVDFYVDLGVSEVWTSFIGSIELSE